MSADDARLIERPVWDASGMERIPYDGRTEARPDTRILTAERNHGRACRPSNPEIGCVCGEDERQELNAEARSLGFFSHDALVEAMGPERMAALARSHNPSICPNPRLCESCSSLVPAGWLTAGQVVILHGGVRAVVQSVTPYEPTDSFVPESPWVTLNYRWAIAAHGETMPGVWSLPASQCLRVVG